jgi:hypothetical protein
VDDHGDEARAWPDGCLLDPHRLPWSFIQTVKRNNPRTYAVQYQQEDGDLVGGLVEPAWIKGEVDPEGYPSPGCLDHDRPLGVVPPHLLNGKGWSFLTVDPSPTMYWAIIWWVYDPDSGNRYIIDMVRRKLGPEQFLSLDLDTYEYSGIAEDWRKRGNTIGAPIKDIVFEINAAQRWFLHQEQVQRWMSATGVRVIPHTTAVNKADPKFGVESLGDLFRQGRVRIPWSGIQARQVMDDFISEHINYPQADTDDTVMSDWFHHLAVLHHYVPPNQGRYRLPTPGFLRHGQQGVQRGMSWA